MSDINQGLEPQTNGRVQKPGPIPTLAAADGQMLALSFLDAFPGPAWLVDDQDTVVAVNLVASNLRIQTLIVEMAKACRSSGRGIIRRLNISSTRQNDSMTLDATATPLIVSPGDHAASAPILILARDVTHDHSLTDALVESRELYRDLLLCSGDFAWETNQAGLFSYISIKTALGFESDQLLGQSSLVLFGAASDSIEPDPFVTDKPLDDTEVWVRAADGTQQCLSIKAVPLFNAQGEWTGARGVCRNVTAEYGRRLTLDKMTERERLIESVIEAMRSAPEPSAMLAMAVHKISAAIDCSVWLLRRDENLNWYAAYTTHDENADPIAIEIGALLDRHGAHQILDHWIGKKHIIARLTRFGQTVNGAMIFECRHGSAEFPPLAVALMESLAAPIGIAIAQAEQIDRLQQLSSIDELTGLLNRRAFMEAARVRFAMGLRQARRAVFLYLDLDHFKLVNDILGHQAGDLILRQMGQMLQRTTRANDLAVRLGGDEFGLWLDAASLDGAIAKATSLIKELPGMVPDMPAGMPPLGLSIGLAELDYECETLEEMIARADRALYEAKGAGRNQWKLALHKSTSAHALAPPPSD